MKPNNEFTGIGKDFWAHIRSLSQTIGYTNHGKGTIRVPTLKDILLAMDSLTLSSDHLVGTDGHTPSDYAKKLIAYFQYRADVLNRDVQFQLQTKEQAEAMYLRLKAAIPSKHVAAKNKQKGEKATVAYLTAMVNLLTDVTQPPPDRLPG